MPTTQPRGTQIKDGTLTDADFASANKDGLAAVPSLRTLGAGAQQAKAGDAAPFAHKNSHILGGSDAFTATDLLNALIKRIRESGGADLLVGAVTEGQLLKRVGTTLVGVNPAVFGQNYQRVEAAARTTTTSTVFQTKLSLVLPAITGTLRVQWGAVVDNNGKMGEFRLQNTTDAVQENQNKIKANDADDRMPVGASVDIVMAGAAKTVEIQFRDVDGSSNQQGIAQAYIESWRVL